MTAIISTFDGEFRFLSNFADVSVVFDGITFPSVEHAYVAAKVTDRDKRLEILQCPSAGKVKRMGKKFKVRDDWDIIKLDVMRDLVFQKFAQEPFRSALLATNDATIIEGNHWGDVFFGVCNGVGENHLGKILMQVRSDLLTLAEPKV